MFVLFIWVFMMNKNRFIVWHACDNCGVNMPVESLVFRYSNRRKYLMQVCSNCAYFGHNHGEFSEVDFVCCSEKD